MTGPSSTPRTLTRRQREVLLLAATGYTNAQIGTRLGIHHNTVNTILGLAYQNLGARDRAHAVALAIWTGAITLTELAAIADTSSQETAA